MVLTGLIAKWVQSEDSGLGARRHGDTKPSNIHVICAFIHSLQPQAFAGAGPGPGAGQAGVLAGDSNLAKRRWRQRGAVEGETSRSGWGCSQCGHK